MTLSSSEGYAPYFSDGKLYIPQKTVELLIQAGLDRKIAQSGLNGLALDDDKDRIGMISNALEKVLEQIAHNSSAFQQLNASDIHFMFTGKPAETD